MGLQMDSCLGSLLFPDAAVQMSGRRRLSLPALLVRAARDGKPWRLLSLGLGARWRATKDFALAQAVGNLPCRRVSACVDWLERLRGKQRRGGDGNAVQASCLLESFSPAWTSRDWERGWGILKGFAARSPAGYPSGPPAAALPRPPWLEVWYQPCVFKTLRLIVGRLDRRRKHVQGNQWGTSMGTLSRQLFACPGDLPLCPRDFLQAQHGLGHGGASSTDPNTR